MSMIVDINDFSNGQIDTTNPQDPKWDGTGVFDIIMKAANENIKIQNQTSRITGAEYAEVYLGTMQTAISEAMKFLLNKDKIIKDLELNQIQIDAIESDILIKQEQHTKDLEVKDKDLEVKTQQILTMKNDDSIKAEQSIKDLDVKTAQENKLIDDLLTAAKQRELYSRQILGFDDNKYQKLFESQLSSWGLMFSSGMLTEKPSIITGDKVSQLYTKLTTGI